MGNLAETRVCAHHFCWHCLKYVSLSMMTREAGEEDAYLRVLQTLEEGCHPYKTDVVVPHDRMSILVMAILWHPEGVLVD